jgi:hypothetical protein
MKAGKSGRSASGSAQATGNVVSVPVAATTGSSVPAIADMVNPPPPDAMLEPEEFGIFEDSVETKQFVRWLMGSCTNPPPAFQKMLANAAMRMTGFLGVFVMEMIERSYAMNKFLRKAEEKIFNADNVDTKTLAELQILYADGMRAQIANLEFVRKYIVQNKESLEGFGSEKDKLYKLLNSLSPEKVGKLLKKLEDNL